LRNAVAPGTFLVVTAKSRVLTCWLWRVRTAAFWPCWIEALPRWPAAANQRSN
jgi:hypothetical protein